jgi:ribosome-binding protein aMBF1 (putative translation factor)
VKSEKCLARSKKAVPEKPGRGRRRTIPDGKRPAARIGAAIRAARIGAGLTVEEAARKLRVPLSRLYQWEAGRAVPRLHQLAPLCDVLGCKLATIIPKAN